MFTVNTELAAEQAPSAPVALRVSTSDAHVELDWRLRDKLATGCVVLRRSETEGPYVEIYRGRIRSNGEGDCWFDDRGYPSNLVNGMTYYYIVVMTGSGGSSVPSVPVAATPFLPVPDSPSELVASAGNGTVYLKWTDPPSDLGCCVFRSEKDRKFALIARLPGGDPPKDYLDSGLVDGQTYTYYIKAYNTSGLGAPSDPATATPFHPLSTAGQAVGVASAFCKAIGQPAKSAGSATFVSSSITADILPYYKPRWLVVFGTPSSEVQR